MRRPILRDERTVRPYWFVIVSLDAHAAGPAVRVAPRLAGEFPGMAVEVFAAAEWSENPGALAAAKAAIAGADLVVANLLFLEEHTAAIAPAPAARRPDCDATIGLISDKSIVGLTRMGDLDMAKPASAAMQMMKKLRGSGPPSADNGPSS